MGNNPFSKANRTTTTPVHRNGSSDTQFYLNVDKNIVTIEDAKDGILKDSIEIPKSFSVIHFKKNIREIKKEFWTGFDHLDAVIFDKDNILIEDTNLDFIDHITGNKFSTAEEIAKKYQIPFYAESISLGTWGDRIDGGEVFICFEDNGEIKLKQHDWYRVAQGGGEMVYYCDQKEIHDYCHPSKGLESISLDEFIGFLNHKYKKLNTSSLRNNRTLQKIFKK